MLLCLSTETHMLKRSCVFCFLLLFGNSVNGQQCQCKCERWNMIVIPMLTHRPNDIASLNNLFENIVGSCKWYYGYLNLHFLTRNLTIIKYDRVYDFLEDELQTEYFAYNETKQAPQKYVEVLKYAIRHMPMWPSDYGRYILILANYIQQPITDEDAAMLRDELVSREIQLRRIQIQIDQIRPARMTQIIGHNISSNVAQVSFVDTDVEESLSSVKPCPKLTPEERVEHYKYAQHYQASSWIKSHTNASLVGGILLLMSIGVVFCGYAYSLYEKRRIRAKEAMRTTHNVIGI